MNQASVSESLPVQPVVYYAARFFSWVFHPLFIGLYIMLYLIYINPEYFMGMTPHDKKQTLIIYIINGVFFPLISVLLCKGLGFVNSIYLKTQKERIIPLTISMVFFFWTFYVFKNKPEIPLVAAQMSLGIFLAVIVNFIANIFFKISLHATGVGGITGLLTWILFTSSGFAGVYLALSILIAGIVSSARLMVSGHKVGDIAAGLVAGFISQWAAAWFLR